jgi:hypothetical protein
MLRRWISWNGDSRTQSTRRRRSFITTSAARGIRLSPVPWAISPSVLTLHGRTIMPIVRNEPLDGDAP